MEFKRLSDVEVVTEPTESANVLIEEDGVIKKAPKTAVGGSGEWDMIIDLDSNFSVGQSDTGGITITSGDCNSIKAKLFNGEFPKILIRHIYEYGDVYYHLFQAEQVKTHDASQNSNDYLVIQWLYTNWDTTTRIQTIKIDDENLVQVYQSANL